MSPTLSSPVSSPVPSPVPSPVSAAAGPAVADLRARIDAIDAELVALVEERCRVSGEIQQARMAAGGPRVVHAREAAIVAHWRGRLGAPGGRIALALLELGRGRVRPGD